MVAEIRRIIFSHGEVATALLAYFTRAGIRAGEGDVVRVEVRDHPHLHVLLSFSCKEDFARVRQLDVPGDVVLSSILLFCKDRRIPIPQAGAKRLQSLGSQLCLTILLNLSCESAAEAEQLIQRPAIGEAS